MGTNSPVEASVIHSAAEQLTKPATVNTVAQSLQRESSYSLKPSWIQEHLFHLLPRKLYSSYSLTNNPTCSLSRDQGVVIGSSHHSVTFSIKVVKAVQPILLLTAAVVPKVTCDLPLQGPPGVKNYSHLKDLSLVDPNFDQPGRIDLLFGCNALQDIFTTDIKKGSPQ